MPTPKDPTVRPHASSTCVSPVEHHDSSAAQVKCASPPVDAIDAVPQKEPASVPLSQVRELAMAFMNEHDETFKKLAK